MMKSTHILSTLCLTSTHMFAHLTHVCDSPCESLAYNPPFMTTQCCGFSGHIDYLYYKAGNELTPYVETSLSENFLRAKKTKYLNYDWNSGFRIGLNYHLPCDCWTLCASWLHYDNKTSIQKDTSWSYGLGTYINMPYGINPLRIGLSPFDSSATSHGHATARLSLNEISLRTSREYYVGTCVTLTPSAALKANFITSRYTQQYQTHRTSNFSSIDTTFHSRNDFKAAGMSSGLESNWLIGCGLGVYAQGEATIYFSDFDLLEKQHNLAYFQEPSSTQTAQKQFQTLTYQLDYALGLRWIVPFHEDQSMFALHLGWEGKYLSEMNHIAESDHTSRAPLILHGIRLGASLTY